MLTLKTVINKIGLPQFILMLQPKASPLKGMNKTYCVWLVENFDLKYLYIRLKHICGYHKSLSCIATQYTFSVRNVQIQLCDLTKNSKMYAICKLENNIWFISIHPVATKGIFSESNIQNLLCVTCVFKTTKQ